MGVAAEIMQQKIIDKGANIICSDDLKITNQNKEMIKISTQGSSFYSKKIFIVTELDDALNFFEKKFQINQAYIICLKFFIILLLIN